MSLLKKVRRRYEPGLKLYYASRWVRGRHVSEEEPIIIGGCDRSGTTLLRAVFDCHPDIAAGPEAWVFTYRIDPDWLASEFGMDPAWVRELKSNAPSLGVFIERFMGAFAEREQKPIWCEKSPRNVLRLDYIWRTFPKAKFVHIIRDGRDVSCSLRTHPKRIRVGNEYVPNTVRRPIRDCIDHWVKYVTAGLEHRDDPRYTEVRYEDLIADYAGTTRRLCEDLGIEWTPELLERERIQGERADTEIVNPEVRQPLYTKAAGRWRSDLSDEELRTIRERAGGLLDRLGYTDEPALRDPLPEHRAAS